jgi:ribosomal protein S18
MPVKVRKLDGKYRVSHSGKVSAKGTTKAKAKKQANLLRAVAHGWKPTKRK